MFDVVIRGGTVLDGTAAPAFRADVALSGGQVAAVGNLDGVRGGTEIDAAGRYVLPGFIDTHVHADAMTLPTSRSRLISSPR